MCVVGKLGDPAAPRATASSKRTRSTAAAAASNSDGSASMTTTCPQVRQVPEVPGHPGESPGIGHEDRGPAVLEAVVDLVGVPPAVEPNEDGAEVDGGPERRAPLGVVLAEHGHPVALADALRRKPGGQGVGVGEELGEGDAAVAVDDELLVPVGHPERLGQEPEVGEPVPVDLHGRAVDLVGDHDLEGPAGAGERGPGLRCGHGRGVVHRFPRSLLDDRARAVSQNRGRRL